ncbi:hypothetical protein [Rhizobium leguminosarum]|uniref:hypothetical protein n=1 Tax=Rhizobium leguminosarum TaxID=384 RepID=UPI001C96FF86|nr:hypothetical protein [Rhizobium leguminosarum]MBY5466411.1 hypothetical protein [Rhizobium leguminosarum]MBY5529384.1 hypothetical protein [Rhizobium leguminosarum]
MALLGISRNSSGWQNRVISQTDSHGFRSGYISNGDFLLYFAGNLVEEVYGTVALIGLGVAPD